MERKGARKGTKVKKASQQSNYMRQIYRSDDLMLNIFRRNGENTPESISEKSGDSIEYDEDQLGNTRDAPIRDERRPDATFTTRIIHIDRLWTESQV